MSVFKLKILGVTAWLVSCSICSASSLIPQPQQIQSNGGEFKMDSHVSFSARGGCQKEVKFFASEFRRVTGWGIPLKYKANVIFVKDTKIKKGYELSVLPKGVIIKAGDVRNLFYGFQTLRQLCPPAIFSKQKEKSLAKGWSIPCLKIQDSPRFPWRGVLVDVSRHFQKKEEMLKLIDAMSMVKLNVLHWHLTDDQGWRPEIKAYPKLTKDKNKSYSQDDLREIVAYATQRGISIIPEIDVPGHSGAVAKAYPRLCVAKPDGKGRHNVYDVSNPEVYKFLDTVFKELSSIFPAPYVHLGADEVGKGAWKRDKNIQVYMKKNNIANLHALQADFVSKVCKIIKKHGRKPIAWDEALEGAEKDLAVMSWRGVQPGMKAAKHGHKVVLCPVSALYYDRTQSRSKNHPRGYSLNTVGLSQSYFFEPRIPTLSDEAKANILGAQGCVWGEKIRSGDHLQRQVMLRGAALAEALWSPRKALDWSGFLVSLKMHRDRLDAAGIPYWWEPMSTPVLVSQWEKLSEGKQFVTIDVTPHIKRAGLHEFLFHYNNGKGSFNIYQVELLVNGVSVAQDAHAYTATVESRRPNQYYQVKIPSFKQDAKYELKYQIQPVKGGASGVVMLVPALAPEEYDPARSPDSSANKSTRKQPDEL